MTEEVMNENENVEEGQVVELEEETTESEEAVTETEPEVEQVEEPVQAESSEEDELAGYSDKVQKRINTLTRKLREAERASESAYNMANTLKTENEGLKKQVVESNQGLYGAKESELQSQRVQAQAALKNALETQDHEKAAKAQDILARIAVEESVVKIRKLICLKCKRQNNKKLKHNHKHNNNLILRLKLGLEKILGSVKIMS